MKIISLYDDIYHSEPDCEIASEALFMIGKLYMDLYHRSFKNADRVQSNEIFTQLQTLFPDNFFADKSRNLVYDPKRSEYHMDDCDSTFIKSLVSTKTDPSTVQGLRVWSNPTYTRVVIDLDE